MGYEVKIIFRGLCPFVPGKELSPSVKPDWVGSFLVNASEGNRRNFKTTRPPHLPFILYNASDLDPKAPNSMAFLRLNRDDVTFKLPSGSGKELTVAFKNGVGETPGQGEGALFNWVVSMDDVMPGRGEVDPDCFEPSPKEGRIIARVHMRQGHLATHDLGGFAGVPVPLHLGNGKRKAVARSVSLTMNCGEGPFQIKMRRFGQKSVKGLSFSERKKPLEIQIVNLCVEDLFLRDGRSLTVEEAARPDEDFRWNYLVSKGVNDLRSAVVPVPDRALLVAASNKASRGGLGGGGGAQCDPPKTQTPPTNFVTAMTGIADGLVSE